MAINAIENVVKQLQEERLDVPNISQSAIQFLHATLRRWELSVSSSSKATAMRSLPGSSRVSSIVLTLSTLRLLCVVS